MSQDLDAMEFADLEELASSRQVPTALVTWAIERPHNYLVNYTLPDNPHLSGPDLERVFFHLGAFRGSAGRLPSCRSYQQREIYERKVLDPAMQELLHRAGYDADPDASLSSSALADLADRGPLGQVLAAGHPAADPPLLTRLVDTHPTARRALVERTDLPAELVTRLASSPEYQVRAALAARRGLPRTLQEVLAGDGSEAVRRALGEHRDLPPDLVGRLADAGTVSALRHPALWEALEAPRHIREDATDVLEEAVSRFSSDPAGAVDPLVEAWRRTRSGRIADLVTRCAGDDALAQLLGSLGGRPYRKGIEHLDTLATTPDDPRITPALVDAIRDVAFPGQDHRPIWWALFQRLARQGDPRARVGLTAIAENPPTRGVAVVRKFIAGGVQRLLALTPQEMPLSDEEAALVALLEGMLPEPVIATEPATSEDGFLAEIYRSPSDDTLRQIYADWLSERGDARGEYILLQLEATRGPLDPKRAERADKLLRKGRSKWNHGFKKVAKVENIRYERGFPTRIHVQKSMLPREAWESALGPWWNTVEEASIGNKAAVWWGAALLGAHTEALRWVVLARTTMLRDMVQRAAADPAAFPKLYGLGVRKVRLDGKDFLAALDGLRQGAFPTLRVLHLEEIVGTPAAQDWASLLSLPGLKALSIRAPRNWKRWASVRTHLTGLDRLHLSGAGPTTLTFTGENLDHLVVHGPAASLARAVSSAPQEDVASTTSIATDGPETPEFEWARRGALPSFWG